MGLALSSCHTCVIKSTALPKSQQISLSTEGKGRKEDQTLHNDYIYRIFLLFGSLPEERVICQNDGVKGQQQQPEIKQRSLISE